MLDEFKPGGKQY